MDENEVVYIVSNPADFGNVSLNGLPTQPSDYSLVSAQKLFGQFLRLANYANLKAGPAGGTDGLIGVFQNARQVIPVTPLPAGVTTPLQLASQNLCQAIASLTRRDPLTIAAVITQLWGAAVIQGTTSAGLFQFTVAPLVNDLGFKRLWEAMQMVQVLGVQPQVLNQTTGIVYPSRATGTTDPGAVIASLLRNAVKSQYTPDQWRPAAQSVFDPLRQKKRDALCAYVLDLPAIISFGATDTNGLFEYFLVDPGMEPVVQTSRIRLALSSVQTFIQRCLLNLEPNVKPSIIDSSQWDWMKRYRVWEANREIFLWPENWLIPEFRENATDLFQALQGTLLQGDITQDLVEQGFAQYLQDLDTRARLDIVSLFNQPADPGPPATVNTLHVIGRHHGKPKKYFYRTFSNGIWSGWLPVTPDIEGDHVVAVVWRGRLTVFWLKFLVQGGSAPLTPPPQANSDGNNGSTPLTSLNANDLSNVLAAAPPPKTVQVQLNWSEYYQGKWTPRKSSDINRFTPLPVDNAFDPATWIFAHASVDTDANGDETAVWIHMDYGGDGWAFRLTGKNCEPAFSEAYWMGLANSGYYNTSAWDATKDVGYAADFSANPTAGSGILQVTFDQSISVSNGQATPTGGFTEPILNNVNSFSLLPCDNLPPWNPIFGPEYAYQRFIDQIAYLSSPFFYEDTSDPNTDSELSFFVQPTLTETSVTSPTRWAVGPSYPDREPQRPQLLECDSSDASGPSLLSAQPAQPTGPLRGLPISACRGFDDQ